VPDYQLGVAYSRFLTSRTTFDASGIYTRGEHEDFKVGDRSDFGTAFAYRLTEDVKIPELSVSAEAPAVGSTATSDAGERNPEQRRHDRVLRPACAGASTRTSR
jgi:hypothetical protein